MALTGKSRRNARQLHLDRLRHGGRREGAGRKPSPDSGVPHLSRPSLSRRHPVHVTLKVVPAVGRLRERHAFGVIRSALESGRDRFGFRLVHFSVQWDHVHLIAEAENKRALSRGVQGLAVRMARRVNKHLARSGKVFGDRYHARALKSPREVRTALSYVLNNFRKHRTDEGAVPWDLTDYERSSAPWFDGWRIEIPFVVTGPPPVCDARSWLLTRGWRRHRLLMPNEVPSAGSVQMSARHRSTS